MDFLCKIRKQLDNISNEDDIQRYCTKTYAKINEYRRDKKLCDVILKVDNQEFPAHRIVLAASSDFFSAMFSCGMSESEQSIIELKSISLDIINEILEYIYTGNVTITNDNVQELLPAANLTQLLGLKHSCCLFLMRQIDPTNVLGIRRFAEIHDCALLERFARKYSAHNLESVLEISEEFVQLSKNELRQLIKMSDLNVYSEESVYKAIIKWVYYSIESRKKWLPNLLRKVRLSQLSVRFLTDIVSNESLIRESLVCRDLIDEAKLYHLRPDVRSNLMHQSNNERYWPRSQGSTHSNHFLVLVGGFGSDQAPIASVEMFDPRTQKWGCLPSLPGRYRYVAACSLASCIYVIGGFDGRERLNTVSVLDVANQSHGWLELAPMHYKRGLAATCVYNGRIYVCGGFDGIARLKSLEVYDPLKNEWCRKSSMDTSREGAGLVVVDGYLYCIGGYNGMQLLDTVEKYDIKTDEWWRSESMHYRRSGAGCAVMNETIYVCGGYGGVQRQGPQHLDSVESYNTLTGQWSFITSMQQPRCYIGAAQMDNMIWVAAGYDGNRLLNTVEAYDKYGLLSNPNQQHNNLSSWNTLKSCPMRYERCDTGMCIVQLYQLAEPLHHHNSSCHLRGPQHRSSPMLELSNISSASSSNIIDDYHTSSTSLITGVSTAVPTSLRYHPPVLTSNSAASALFNSQSGQPVPSSQQHHSALGPTSTTALTLTGHILDYQGGSGIGNGASSAPFQMVATNSSSSSSGGSIFDEAGGTDELEGRGGPQVVSSSSAIHVTPFSTATTGHSSTLVNMEVPGSVQMRTPHSYASSNNIVIDSPWLSPVATSNNSRLIMFHMDTTSSSHLDHHNNPTSNHLHQHSFGHSSNAIAAAVHSSLSSSSSSTILPSQLDNNQDAFAYLNRILTNERQNSITSLSSDEASIDKDEDNPTIRSTHSNQHLLNMSMPFLTLSTTTNNQCQHRQPLWITSRDPTDNNQMDDFTDNISSHYTNESNNSNLSNMYDQQDQSQLQQQHDQDQDLTSLPSASSTSDNNNIDSNNI